jgi:hypothetical protein
MTTPSAPSQTIPGSTTSTQIVSVAMTEASDTVLREHLLRADGQEDLCLATYAPSSGSRRWTALLREFVEPWPGERTVHGNVSFTGAYVVRAATQAAAAGFGVAILHSHPRGRGWQHMSAWDADAEQSYAHLCEEITGLPLLGMTLAGVDQAWSARTWTGTGTPVWAESVRVDGGQLRVSWNDDLRPPPQGQDTQERTISAWGPHIQADLARLRILVVGVGSVGLDVAVRLAAAGVQHLAVMDPDVVERRNLDRLIGATRRDAAECRPKIDVAVRLARAAATAEHADIVGYRMSICDPSAHTIALDYDVIFSCVDRPWPRAILNSLAYTDLIPVLDGGIGIDAFDDGTGMRNATVRTHVLRPGRPCMVCNKQLDLALVQIDRQGLLDDPRYIAAASRGIQVGTENVALLSPNVSTGLLNQFVSLTAAPGGETEPGPLRFSLSTHELEHLPYRSSPGCYVEQTIAAGDARPQLTETPDRRRFA